MEKDPKHKDLRKWPEKRKRTQKRGIKDLYSVCLDKRCPFKQPSAVGFSANEDRLLTSMTVQALNLLSLETLNFNKQLFVLMEEHLPHHRVSSQVNCYHTSFWLEYRLCSMLSELFFFFL